MSDKPKRVVHYEGILIGAVPREGDKVKETRVYLREYKETWYIEVRRWLDVPTYNGPDKRGITFQISEGQRIAELIEKAVKMYEREAASVSLEAVDGQDGLLSG